MRNAKFYKRTTWWLWAISLWLIACCLGGLAGIGDPLTLKDALVLFSVIVILDILKGAETECRLMDEGRLKNEDELGSDASS